MSTTICPVWLARHSNTNAEVGADQFSAYFDGCLRFLYDVDSLKLLQQSINKRIRQLLQPHQIGADQFSAYFDGCLRFLYDVVSLKLLQQSINKRIRQLLQPHQSYIFIGRLIVLDAPDESESDYNSSNDSAVAAFIATIAIMHQSLSTLLESNRLTSTTSRISDRFFALASTRRRVSTFIAWCRESTCIVLPTIASIHEIKEMFIYDDINDPIAHLIQLHVNTPVSGIASFISVQHLYIAYLLSKNLHEIARAIQQQIIMTGETEELKKAKEYIEIKIDRLDTLFRSRRFEKVVAIVNTFDIRILSLSKIHWSYVYNLGADNFHAFLAALSSEGDYNTTIKQITGDKEVAFYYISTEFPLVHPLSFSFAVLSQYNAIIPLVRSSTFLLSALDA
ncbi:hypothetical protein MP638_000095 [Amoeboaphelidium occidentale]|nr:hypothetical protein MP638_000095 [Amoeboaphelidium occidentale]